MYFDTRYCLARTWNAAITGSRQALATIDNTQDQLHTSAATDVEQ
jgi:hypothetical protein